MLAGIRDILIISTPGTTPKFARLLEEGGAWRSIWNIRSRRSRVRIAQAFLTGKSFVGAEQVVRWCSGDNIF